MHAFTVTQTGGTWQTAQQVTGITTLSRSTLSVMGTDPADACGIPSADDVWGAPTMGTAMGNCGALSCGSVGNCSAGGGLYTRGNGAQAFTVTQTGGTWHTAQQVPGSTALNTGKNASILRVSCPPAGPCTSAGSYRNLEAAQIFVVG